MTTASSLRDAVVASHASTDDMRLFVAVASLIAALGHARLVVQPQSGWNLARISHRAPNAAGYVYDERAGDGVTVFVLDTGIDVAHPGEWLSGAGGTCCVICV